MTTTMGVSEGQRVDTSSRCLDQICDHMNGFRPAEEAWLSSITLMFAHLALCHAGNLRKPGR